MERKNQESDKKIKDLELDNKNREKEIKIMKDGIQHLKNMLVSI